MNEWQRTLAAAAVAVATVLVARPARAEERKAVERKAVDPNALRALKEMGKYLRDLKEFEVEAVVTSEDVLDSGEKLQRVREVSVLAARPNRLRAEVTSDSHQRLFLYDGRAFTMVAERLGYYATMRAPDTIRKLVDELEEKHGINLPLVDLFRWGESEEKRILSAIEVGPSVVEGTNCAHYAFRQKDIDWQVWIQLGKHPLPRKLVITSKTDPARPQHSAVYTWNLAPAFNDAAFGFEAPSGFHQVAFTGAMGALPAKKGKQGKQGKQTGGTP